MFDFTVDVYWKLYKLSFTGWFCLTNFLAITSFYCSERNFVEWNFYKTQANTIKNNNVLVDSK